MSVIADLTAADTYTDWIVPKKLHEKDSKQIGRLTLSIYGTWAGTLTVQRRFCETTTGEVVYTSPLTVDTFSANTEKNIEDPDGRVEYRIGFEAGNYTSGTASVRIGD
jgi:hypothetical protein